MGLKSDILNEGEEKERLKRADKKVLTAMDEQLNYPSCFF